MGQEARKEGDREQEKEEEIKKKKKKGLVLEDAKLPPIMIPYLASGTCSVSSGPANKHLIMPRVRATGDKKKCELRPAGTPRVVVFSYIRNTTCP